jgi:hypothetical protein
VYDALAISNNSYTQYMHIGSGQGTGHNTIRPTAIVILEASIEALCEAWANRDKVSLKLAYRRCARHKPSEILLLKTYIETICEAWAISNSYT